jgi:hypothetical protein
VRRFRLPVLEALPGDAGWDAALAPLAQELDAAALPAKTRVACVVPDRHARYLVVPWNAAMQSRAARQAFAAHCFAETYGELARDWVVRAAPGDYASPSLACAVDAALLDALGRLFAQRGLALVSVTPSLAHELAHAAGALPPGASWVVVAEAGAMTMLLVEDGRPLRVAVARAGPDELPSLLAREWFALGRDEPWAHLQLCTTRVAQAA